MRKLLLVTLQLMLVASVAKSQCPVAGFNLPDTVCAGQNFLVSNTSAGGTSFIWDLCPGDLATAPTSSNLSLDPALNFPQQIRVINDNGNFYIFVANLLANNLLRYDFGNDIDNTPVIYNYGNINGLLNQPAGLEVINDNGTWYAFISNAATNNIIRVDLGAVISNNTTNATDLGLFGLITPRGIKIVKDAGDYYAFISSVTGNSLTKIGFGSSLGSNTLTSIALTDPSFDIPWGFDIAYDCTINSWVGFYASNTLSKINVIDFGSSLSNLGTVVSSIPCLSSPSGIGLTRDGSDWYILLNSFSTTEFQKIKISGSLLTVPSLTQIQIIPQSTSPRNVSILRDSSTFKVFIANNAPSSIIKLEFSQPCASEPPVSSDPVSITPLVSLLNAYQEIVLEAYGPNGEMSLYTDSVFISEAPQAVFTKINVCEGDTVVFTDASIVNPNLVTTWQWDFGDGSPINTDQNPVHLYADSGVYTVTLTVAYATGCSSVFTDLVTVYPLPEADFSFQNNQCSAVPVLFTDLSQALSGTVVTGWVWDFGDGSATNTDQQPLHAFTNPGTYTVLLVVTTDAGCIDSIGKTITILPAPVADFTTLSTCIGETVGFTNTTAIQGGGSINYDWDFGDSFTSPLTNPTHQYAPNAANYSVTMIATASNGCKDTIIQDIRISNKPVPQFSWSPLVVCEFNQVSFTSTSFGTGGDTISAYLWDFGDSGTSTDENPFHAYSDTGFYSVTLTVVSPTACDSSITQQVYVIASPTGTFTASNVCLGVTTSFNPLSTTPPNTQIDSIVWDFGDGTTFTGLSSPSHQYAAPGRYGVTMTVYNDLLCNGTYIDSVDVYPIPVAAFTTSLACSGSPLTFDGTTSQVTGDTLSTWLWDFDGLGNASDSIAQFEFQNAGNYDVTLIVSSIHGCQDTLTSPVSVIQSPQFDFTFNEPCFGLPSSFTYLPLVNPAPSVLLSWDFGDGFISTQLSPVYTYSSIDSFTVSLMVIENSTGCSTIIEKLLVIKPYPDAGFAFANGCEDLPIQFSDTSTIASGTIISYDWNFGMLGNSSAPDPLVIPPDPGNYPVTLTVTSNEGCASVVTDSITVFGNPSASFTPDPLYGSPPLSVNFINSTTGGVSFEWLFGDGSTGAGTSVNHIYQDTGLYNISLIATSAEGCIDSTGGLVSVLIPFLDIAVNKIYLTEDNNLLTVTAELLNVGNLAVSTFQISANIQNGSVINEAWNGDFQPGDVLLYTFNARYDINSKSLPGFYCVEAVSPNNDVDQNMANNSKCAVINNLFEVFSIVPNPFTDQMALNLNLPAQGDYEVTIFDMTGKITYNSATVTGLKGFNKLVIPTLNFAKGVYAVVVRYREEVKTINALRY